MSEKLGRWACGHTHSKCPSIHSLRNNTIRPVSAVAKRSKHDPTKQSIRKSRDRTKQGRSSAVKRHTKRQPQAIAVLAWTTMTKHMLPVTTNEQPFAMTMPVASRTATMEAEHQFSQKSDGSKNHSGSTPALSRPHSMTSRLFQTLSSSLIGAFRSIRCCLRPQYSIWMQFLLSFGTVSMAARQPEVEHQGGEAAPTFGPMASSVCRQTPAVASLLLGRGSLSLPSL